MAKDWGKVFLSENCNVAIPSSRNILYYILDMSSVLLGASPCTAGRASKNYVHTAGRYS